MPSLLASGKDQAGLISMIVGKLQGTANWRGQRNRDVVASLPVADGQRTVLTLFLIVGISIL
jgi:hypothetical protein